MPIVCWGALGKAANDPTTIDQEIQAYVTAHNADPNAHGLSGYAIQLHRSTDPLDHVDYSVTSAKISADQIVGKDFRTDEDVGPGRDGVIFNPLGIMMYQAGRRRVNIPISGDPTFEGKLSVSQIFFLKTYVAYYFDSFDQIVMSHGLLMNGGKPRMGYAQFATYASSAYAADFRIGGGALGDAQRIFIEMQFENFIGTASHGYIGMGEVATQTDDDYGYGFAFLKGSNYATISNEGDFACYPIKPFDRTLNNFYRIEVDTTIPEARWYVNGNLYFTFTKSFLNVPIGLLWNLRMFTFNATTNSVYMRYLGVGELAD